MKNAAEYARKIKRLLTTLRKEGSPAKLPLIEDPMDALLQGILGNYAADARAATAASKLRSAFVDLNELRVTPPSEIVAIIGSDYPMGRAAAEEVTRSLTAVFNKLHNLDLAYLKKSAKRSAETFLNSLDAVSPHAKGVVLLRCLHCHAVPVDIHTHAYMQKAKCIPDDANAEQAQKLLTQEVSEREAMGIYVLIKKYASAHAPRKLVERAAAMAGAHTHYVPPPPPPVMKSDAIAIEVEEKRTDRKSSGSSTAVAKRAVPSKKPARRK
jgi:endonuclease III